MIDPSRLVLLVTGATSGFGEAVARRFIAAGARVIGTGRRADRLDALAAELGDRFLPLTFDVTDRPATDAALASLTGPWAEIDVLVNNAGLAMGLEPAWQVDMADWDVMIATNCTALAYMTRKVLPGMVARGRGHVVNLSSVAATRPYPGGNVYGATKAFVSQLSDNLRADLIGHPIRVTAIEPGLCQTEFSLVRFKGDAARAEAPYRGVQPLSADDVAETVWWAVTLPAHININRMEVMPVMQAFGPFVIHREG
ncbi:MAG TPA: SDR family oxidoreductase [Myxococcota bacterium]|nr:SDR family oxidoreductase [Myxococcota bacterium]